MSNLVLKLYSHSYYVELRLCLIYVEWKISIKVHPWFIVWHQPPRYLIRYSPTHCLFLCTLACFFFFKSFTWYICWFSYQWLWNYVNVHFLVFHQIARIFEGKACSEIQQSTLTLAKHLAHAVKGTFLNFEEIIEKDSTKTMVADGTVHPLSSYVINYMKFLFELVLILPLFYLNISNWFGIHSSNSLIFPCADHFWLFCPHQLFL